jgi:hypothetical protein
MWFLSGGRSPWQRKQKIIIFTFLHAVISWIPVQPPGLRKHPMRRLTIEVSEQQHQKIKAMAALNGQTLKEYTLTRLFPLTSDEAQAMQELEALLRQRIAAAEQGEISTLGIDAIVADELQEGGMS